MSFDPCIAFATLVASHLLLKIHNTISQKRLIFSVINSRQTLAAHSDLSKVFTAKMRKCIIAHNLTLVWRSVIHLFALIHVKWLVQGSWVEFPTFISESLWIKHLPNA